MNIEEQLIEHVKKYPFLFDPFEKEYRKKKMRNEAWESIGGMLEISGNECRDLWIKLRNAYTHAMKRRKTKSGQGTKNLVKWKYEDEMRFLAHTLEKRTTRGNMEPTEEDPPDGEEIPRVELSASLPPKPLEKN